MSSEEMCTDDAKIGVIIRKKKILVGPWPVKINPMGTDKMCTDGAKIGMQYSLSGPETNNSIRSLI